MFKSQELYLIHKLLNKIKYSEFEISEFDDFAYSPITNEILEKLNLYFDEKIAGTHLAKNNSKSCFEFENQIGIAIRNRIKQIDDNYMMVISKWTYLETEKFALDIIGPIAFEKVELDKLTEYITELAEEKTSR